VTLEIIKVLGYNYKSLYNTVTVYKLLIIINIEGEVLDYTT